jgi:simple sugar transport system substrate-binding protein
METSNVKTTKALLLALALSTSANVAALADGIPDAPPPFDKGNVKLAFISYLSQGDYFQAYEAGVARQAKALGVDLHIFQGKQEAALEREQVEQAINLGVALDNPKVPQISQNDHAIAQAVLDQALKENGNKFEAGYVYVSGFRPLDLRDEVWSAVKKANPDIQEHARWGAVDSTTATSVGNQTSAALRAHLEITVVFAPYDEFARGVQLGATEAGVASKIKIYSADISTSDIQEIRQDGSPWVATPRPIPLSPARSRCARWRSLSRARTPAMSSK